MNHGWQIVMATMCLATTIPFGFLRAQEAFTSLTLRDENFRPELILDDSDIFELGRMKQAEIQGFLDSRGGLGRMQLRDIDGRDKSTAEIIWRVATSYKINPQYLLALLQKEQSLVEDAEPSQRQLDWATGYGVCDSCSKDDPSIQEFKGFASQLEWAAKQHREKYLQQLLSRGATIAGQAPGKPTLIDGQIIVPINRATAMLYSYTPHLHGNLNLWRIWQRWFGLALPDGTVAESRTSGQIYLIRFGMKRPFRSRAVALSMIDVEKIIRVDDSALGAYPIGPSLQFSNFALVEHENGKRYLIDGSRKRLIVNAKVFQTLGFNEDELIMATNNDLLPYEDGPDITLGSKYPLGLLAQDNAGTYWYIVDGVRHTIPDKTLLKHAFRSRPARKMAPKALGAIPIGEPFRLRDGELVKVTGTNGVAVIEHGKRRPIPSAEIFETIGWRWHNVMTLPSRVLEAYPVGEPVSLYVAPQTISVDG